MDTWILRMGLVLALIGAGWAAGGRGAAGRDDGGSAHVMDGASSFPPKK